MKSRMHLCKVQRFHASVDEPTRKDYAVVAKALRPFASSARAITEAPLSPHSPFTLTISGLNGSATVTRQHAARRFPFLPKTEIVTLDPYPDLRWCWPADAEPGDLEEAIGNWYDNVEEYLIRVHDLDSHVAKGYRGRSKGYWTEQVSLDTLWRESLRSRASPEAQAWKQLEALLRKQATVAAQCWGGHPAWHRLHQLQRAVAAVDADFDYAEGDLADHSPATLAKWFSKKPSAAQALLLKRVAEHAEQWKSWDVTERKKQWREHASAMVTKGGRLAHAYSKGPQQPQSGIHRAEDPGSSPPMPLGGDAALEALEKEWLPPYGWRAARRRKTAGRRTSRRCRRCSCTSCARRSRATRNGPGLDGTSCTLGSWPTSPTSSSSGS